jgi:hypothetical protein
MGRRDGNSDNIANSVQLPLQLQTGTELGKNKGILNGRLLWCGFGGSFGV